MIATWLVPHGKKKKSPCGLPPRLFSFHPRLGLGEAGAAGSQTRAPGQGARVGRGSWFTGQGNPRGEDSALSSIQQGWVPAPWHTHTSDNDNHGP